MTDEEVDYLNNEPIFEEWCDSHKKHLFIEIVVMILLININFL